MRRPLGGRGRLLALSLAIIGIATIVAGLFLSGRVRAWGAGRPEAALDTAVAELWQTLGVFAALASLTAFALSTTASHWLSQEVSRLAETMRRLASGESGLKVREAAPQELGELGRALERLAASLFGAMAQLRAERDGLSRVLDAMDEGVLVLDDHGRIEHANPALREMLLLNGDPRGRSLLEVIRSAEVRQVLAGAEDGAPSTATEIDLGGLKPRRVRLRATRLPPPGGLLVAFVDVTELRRLETLRRDFVANVSHELRNPLAALRSAAETLRGALREDPEAADRFLDIVERNGGRMQRLVDDLLELARAESRELRLCAAPLELAPAVESTAAGFRARASERGIQLACSIPSGLVAVADSRALEQVLANLLDNALKYGPEGGRVAVRAEADRRQVRVSVEDSGPGIEARHLPRLFERFYRVDAGRSRELGGTGLGLSIVKHLVEGQGGTVGIESVVGKGSTFWFTLPLEAPQPRGARS